MPKKLHIDIETYSSVDLRESGAYKYMESLDFEILIVAYALDHEDVKVIDLAQGEELPEDFLKNLQDPNIEKHAHNATFERNAFRVYGYDVPIDQWRCTSVKAAYCGLPLGK
jgi:DNA polymerase